MTVLRTNTAAMGIWSRGMEQVGNDVRSFITRGPSSSEVQVSHGSIGFSMQSAFDAVHAARAEALGNTQADSAKISETLNRAAQAYDRGDEEAARKLRAQAERMDAAQIARTGGSIPAGGQGATQASGQMVGQFTQMVGQAWQGVAQPAQSVMQGLAQAPQQVMQGVQGVVQAATQGTAGGGETAARMTASAPSTPVGAGARNVGEKAPVQQGIMSEARMREIQGLPIDGDTYIYEHGGGCTDWTEAETGPEIIFARQAA